MLRVTIEIVPFGIESRARVISRLFIANIKSRPNNVSDYHYKLEDIDNTEQEVEGTVKNFERDNGHLALVKRVLSNLLRKKDARPS